MEERIPKPKLIIRANSVKMESSPDNARPMSGFPVITPGAITPGGDGVTPGGSGAPKIKISLNKLKSQPQTPVTGIPPTLPSAPARIALPASTAMAPPPTRTGRVPKATKKKRLAAQSPDSEEEPNVKKKIRFTSSTKGPASSGPRKLNIRSHTKVKYHRESGDGYDSELEDREEDPHVEEQIILRMMEGVENDYMSSSLDAKKYPGAGMDFKLKWLDERRASITVKHQVFAAVLVDLPTITESMKTWDKKTMVKSADICQMLLVFAKVANENEARTAELPKVIFDGHRWPHGLTPPMHDCVHRRFRKRLSKKEIMDKEAEVQRLLKADQDCISSEVTWIDDRASQRVDSSEADDDEDAEGEEEDENYFGVQHGGYEVDEEVDDDLEAELMKELEEALPGDGAASLTPADSTPAGRIPGSSGDVNTPGAGTTATTAVNSPDNLFDDDDDDDDEDSDDDDSAAGLDDAEKERRDEIRGIREEVAEITRAIVAAQAQLDKQTNPILQKRMREKINSIKKERTLKLAQIGEGEDEEEADD